MLNDSEYREQVLQSQKIDRDKKRQAIKDDPLHVDARKNANRMARVKRVTGETQNILDTQKRENMIEKVRQRYIYFI